MTVINWNPLVNTKFSLEGDFNLQDGYIQELKFNSGKKRTWLKNSYVPYEYQLSLILDNKTPKEKGKTEFEVFKEWFNESLRYGSLPFQVTRIGFKRKEITKIDEMGIYTFIGIPKYDGLDGLITVTFSIEEISTISEVEYTFLSTNDNKILFTNNAEYIIAY
jgi:hypothetical protein